MPFAKKKILLSASMNNTVEVRLNRKQVKAIMLSIACLNI